MPTVKEIAKAIEDFAPRHLQEDFDNAGLQVGDPDMEVKEILVCLDVTEEILDEAIAKQCNLIVTHHPLIFGGIKEITGRNLTQKIVIKAIKNDIAIYSAHTNLDNVWDGVSHQMAHELRLSNITTLEPKDGHDNVGLGVIGDVTPTPALEFLRNVKVTFNVKALKCNTDLPKVVVRKVAVCGGSGASLIKSAIKAEADIIITGDVKYHDFTTYANDIIIADIGHYESELCTKKIFKRIISEKFVNFVVYLSEKEKNPIKHI
ncbi:MAG: Nif3-like dinuclear metal center hexameric protein [Muribaculaceae bacterium]|jgi:dinuclear metal center YbgI/SA1388 family protein|nr:Nif3-like dinuclear metal center hexameric protein [Muribaculaceae bacterium]MBQ2371334.1 Nif3-like dinuclear metal center hexameric protein [Muribaculaceae bacterium]MBQ2400017.1 Nif3-like dinuclear metal center hexameric protein [Muribaculaceae bacterium]MBQ5697224.1 Nif3-like dinuclear metal center hexameric protein [Muribaculaceae bacterium]MBR4887329.1 Nif3-like dinuclear metal center hexameric protein [Muribaculaceae bacterium]